MVLGTEGTVDIETEIICVVAILLVRGAPLGISTVELHGIREEVLEFVGVDGITKRHWDRDLEELTDLLDGFDLPLAQTFDETTIKLSALVHSTVPHGDLAKVVECLGCKGRRLLLLVRQEEALHA